MRDRRARRRAGERAAEGVGSDLFEDAALDSASKLNGIEPGRRDLGGRDCSVLTCRDVRHAGGGARAWRGLEHGGARPLLEPLDRGLCHRIRGRPRNAVTQSGACLASLGGTRRLTARAVDRVTTCSSVRWPWVVTFVATPLVGALARWRGWLYEPNDRTVHTQPMPAIGGLAMFIGFIVALAVARCWTASTRCSPATPSRRASCWRRRSSSPSACTTTSRGISAPAKVTGDGDRRAGPRLVRRDHVLLPPAVPRRLRTCPTTGSRWSRCCGCSG